MGKGSRLKKNRDLRGGIPGGKTDKRNLDPLSFAPGSYEDIMVAAAVEFEEFLKKYGSTAQNTPGTKARVATDVQSTPIESRTDEHGAGETVFGDGNGLNRETDPGESSVCPDAATLGTATADMLGTQVADAPSAGFSKKPCGPDSALDSDLVPRQDSEALAAPAFSATRVYLQDPEKSEANDGQRSSSAEEDAAPILMGQIFYRPTGPDSSLQPRREAEQTLNAIALFCAKRAETGLYIEKAGAGDWGAAFSGMRLADLAAEVGQPVDLVAYYLEQQEFRSVLSGEGEKTTVTDHATCGQVLTFFSNAANVQTLIHSMDEKRRQAQYGEEPGTNNLGESDIPEDTGAITHVAESAHHKDSVAGALTVRNAEPHEIAAPVDVYEAPADRTDAPAGPTERSRELSLEASGGSDGESEPRIKAATRVVLARASAWKRLASERYHNRVADLSEHKDSISIVTEAVRKSRSEASAMWKRSRASERVDNTLAASKEVATSVWNVVREWIDGVVTGRQPTVAEPSKEVQARQDPDEIAGPEDYPFDARLLSRHVNNRLPKGIFWANGDGEGYMAGRDFMKRLMTPGAHFQLEDIDRCLQAIHKLCARSKPRPGLNLEKLGSGPDQNHWSIRASEELRIILAVEGGGERWTRFAPVYMGHHNDAYDWAGQRGYYTDLDGDAMWPLMQQDEIASHADAGFRGVRKLSDMLAHIERQAPRVEIAGTARIQECFRISGTGIVAGCRISRGVIQLDDTIFVLRGHAMIHVGRVETMKQGHFHISAAVAGSECGIRIKDWNILEVGDRIKSYEIVEASQESEA